jgi:hypothetical protein
MTYMIVSSARIGFVALVAAAITAGLCSEAVATHGKRHRHAHRLIPESRGIEPDVQLASQQPVRLGPMRYYGGPKSPMWREAR